MADGGLIVGVDGGGTRTRCIAIDAAGHFVAAGESGPLMGLYAGQDAAEEALDEALGRCAAGVPKRAGAIERVCISVPICDRERLAAVVRVVGHAGGFGPLLGDDGSGYAIGIGGLRAAVRASQGRGGPTSLVEAACEHFGVSDLWGLVERLYGGGLPREQIAGFTPAVVRLADNGDAAGAGVVRQAADDLADMARAAVQQAGWYPRAFPVVLCGGVLDGSETLRRTLGGGLAEVAPRAEPIASRFAPVVGVALLAMGRRRAAMPATIANLEQTLPAMHRTGR